MELIRHGESEANILDIWGGNYPLTELGRKQAQSIPAKGNVFVVTSELKRAIETASIVYPYTTITVDPVFNEIYFGNVENKVIDFAGEAFESFILTPSKFHKLVNGDDMEYRARAALERMKEYPENTVFFTHGTLMQAIRSVYKYGTVDKMHDDARFENCEKFEI